jgi:hypothetical protein
MKKVQSSKPVADGVVRDDYRAGSIFTLLQSGEDPILWREPSELR